VAGSPGLDRFTRTYLVVLTVIAVAGIAWWLSTWDSRLSQMNKILASDAQLAGYPYQFKVISLENGVAEISSPRSAEVPVIQFLRIIHPEFNNSSVVDESVMAAQDELARMQSHAGKLVSDMDEVDSIRWTIDRKWYASNGVYLD
jgi:hypothetical protein